jgi:hypothetical protein
VRLQRAAVMLAAAVVAARAARRLRARRRPAAGETPAGRPRPATARRGEGDPLDHLAAEVEARSDASDVVSVVEDLLTAPAEERKNPG